MTLPAAKPPAPPMLDIARIRADFPILARRVNHKPLAYLDTAGSAQKPRAVITAMTEMMEDHYANVHRGVHRLSAEATDAMEKARKTVARFLNAAPAEIVFTHNATDSINLVAHGIAQRLQPCDEILVSALEHHANLIPWQQAARATGAVLKIAPLDGAGRIDMAGFQAALSPRTRMVAITGQSNAIGTIVPLEPLIRLAHAAGAEVLIDACQMVLHRPIDVKALDCDYLVFSGHKLYGPTGIGVLWGKKACLSALPPWRTGGNMITTVTYQSAEFAAPPARFEAGTPPIIEAIGLAAAIDYVTSIGWDAIEAHEAALSAEAEARLSDIPGLTLLGPPGERGGILSFTIAGIHPHDLGTVLDDEGVAVRAGHHCAQPLMGLLGVPATVRASFALYNDRSDIDALIRGIDRAIDLFGRH